MARTKPDSKRTDALRKKAEARITRQLDRIESASAEDIPRLIHELRIHQVELEVQNEELRLAQSELEVSRSKYAHLYDFAPVAYLTISTDGVIEETNLTAKSFLGANREPLVGSRVLWLIAAEDSALFHQHMTRTLETGVRQTCQLRLREREGKARHVQIESVSSYGGQEKLLAAVIDITPQKKLEKRIQEAHDELEARVKVRTADLVKAKEMLEAEVSERRRAEASLRTHEEELEKLNAHLKLEIEKRKKFEEGLKSSTEKIIQEHNHRKALSRQLVELLEKDRREVAMALHDHAGQILTTLKMDLETIEKKIGQGPERLKLEAAKNKALELLAFTKDTSAQLRPSTLDTLGLVASVRNLIDQLPTTAQEKVVFHAGDLPRHLGQDVEIALYRIIQESLTNALKYAHAENINVNLIQKGRRKAVILSIEDDGRGFEHSDEPFTTLEPGHLGITIMRERAVMLGGDFRIESQPGKGTVVMVEIPFGE